MVNHSIEGYTAGLFVNVTFKLHRGLEERSQKVNLQTAASNQLFFIGHFATVGLQRLLPSNLVITRQSSKYLIHWAL